MNTRTIFLVVLTTAAVLFLGYGFSFAGSGATAANSKIGTVSIRDVFRDCKANASYREKALAEQNTRSAEIDLLQKEIAAQEAGLQTLKPSSVDYMKQYEALINKQAQLEAKKQFLSQQRSFEDGQWTELLYKEVLRITKELAKAKGLTAVLGVDEPVFPMASTDELMMALQTHKVFYSDGCVNLTAEVVSELDKVQLKLKP
ncbi:MAG: OmpH family outer membrane protein [Sedimentisphaerales bacterium]|nr:OmpH family outer membrane protein [Sedimentisphaerales bacterium]